MEPTASCVYTINVRIHVNALVSVCTTFLKREVLTFILLNVDVKDKKLGNPVVRQVALFHMNNFTMLILPGLRPLGFWEAGEKTYLF